MRAIQSVLFVVVILVALTHSTWAINRIHLSQAQASFIGEEVEDHAGQFVSIGDVNGDEYADCFIGAQWSDAGGYYAGQVYLFYGRPDGWQMRTSLSEADASFIGNEEDGLGWIYTVGDVNGDHFGDFLVCSPDKRGPRGTRVGESYLFLGKTGGWEMLTDMSQADASFLGVMDNSKTGMSNSIGDVNNDGYADILLGAPLDFEVYDNPGWTYVLLGKSDGWEKGTNLTTANASFIGENVGDMAGLHLSCAGDINGDGYSDILIGAQENEYNGYRAGQVYIIFGMADGWERGMNLSSSDASFFAEGPWNTAGPAAAAGDVNGDGYDDFLIGAFRNSDGGEYAGQVYLFFGKPDGWSMRTSLSQADASFIGEGEWSFTGDPVVGAGDVNNDGYDDFLIGAGANRSRGEGIGRVYLIFGRSDGWRMRTPLAEADIAFVGEEIGDIAGMSISSGGDVNNDGFGDILIGAYYNSYGGEMTGQAYLIFDLPVTITTPKLPERCVDEPYELAFSATRGTPPYSWSLISGSLPDDLEMNSSGVISGVPSSTDTSEFTVQVTDAVSDTNSKTFSIMIRETGGKGDINGDCQFNIIDVIFTINIILELLDPTPAQLWSADCTEDGVVNIIDAICLVQIILGGR